MDDLNYVAFRPAVDIAGLIVWKLQTEVLAGTLSTFPNFTDAQQWVMEHASCPQQGK